MMIHRIVEICYSPIFLNRQTKRFVSGYIQFIRQKIRLSNYSRIFTARSSLLLTHLLTGKQPLILNELLDLPVLVIRLVTFISYTYKLSNRFTIHCRILYLLTGCLGNGAQRVIL